MAKPQKGRKPGRPTTTGVKLSRRVLVRLTPAMEDGLREAGRLAGAVQMTTMARQLIVEGLRQRGIL
jgi:hypothetical protein